ncbi:benzaldehyde dehydrogenase [Kribbella sp. NPDC056951]|uniref:benzaldehyde dehydrogenase n=1 Tax=Kribbella sp. NPDC056951 TaxID=3345978 RepID=UPI00363521F3
MPSYSDSHNLPTGGVLTATGLKSLDPAQWSERIWVDGQWRSGGGGQHPIVSPATGEQLGKIGFASPADVDASAESAMAAQREWAARSYKDRAAVLRRAGDVWTAHSAEIVGWLERESGSATAKAEHEVATAAEECYEAAALAAVPYGDVLRSAQPRLSISRRLPVGLVAVIAPFNAPIVLSIRAVAPALALGNAVLLKPDSRTTVSGGVTLAAVFEEAGLPKGLLQMLPGRGADVGERLITTPHTRVIAFTGSTGAGRRVGELAAHHLKRAHLELGGNNALIVLEDADLEHAPSVGAMGSFIHQGQICMVTGRQLVHESIADEYVAKLAERAQALTVGDPAGSRPVQLGPLIDQTQRDRVDSIVRDTVSAGAELKAGGTFDGLFYRPTVLDHVRPGHRAFREEIFGPVAPITRFATLDEAIELACDTEYGLSLGILTGDVLRGLELADRIPSGNVHINDQTVNDEVPVPFGGVGDSGTGSRHGGHQSNLEAFTELQWVTMRSELPRYPF